MKKILALFVVLFVVLGSAVGAFAHDNDAVVRWKTIVGNITVSNNDAVGGINPGTTPWSTLGGGRTPLHVATIRHFRPRAPLQESSAKVGIPSARARAQ